MVTSRKTSSFTRLDAWLLATSLIASTAIALVHCGSSAVCGNGKTEGDEQCDYGSRNGVTNSGCSTTCTIAALNVASTNIFITHLKDETPGFPSVSCTDLQSAKQHVVLVGPTPADSFDMVWDCAMTSKITTPVTPGPYQVTVTLLDSAGNPITKSVTSAQVTAVTGQMANLPVNFAYTDFLKTDYIGTLYFEPSWGAASTGCTSASPPVTGYGVTLTDSSGNPVSGMTTGNHDLAGTESACFVPTSSGTAEAVAGIPWGHYTLGFTGYAGTEVAYCKSFDVFNGPGTTNPAYDLVVPGADADAGACN